jgi:hypothetical protein
MRYVPSGCTNGSIMGGRKYRACSEGSVRVISRMLVEMGGLEPPTSCMPCKRSGQLSYIPMPDRLYVIANGSQVDIYILLIRCFAN